MIAVPESVCETLARAYGTRVQALSHFGGGQDWSDGVVYAYPHAEGEQLLKVMAYPAAEARRGLYCLTERLAFMRYVGEGGAPVAYPRPSLAGRLYETAESEEHLWVGYRMAREEGEAGKGADWDAPYVPAWGRAVGRLHRLAQAYPSWRSSLDPESGQAWLTWEEEWQGFDALCQDPEVRRKWGEIRGQLEALPVARDGFGFVHNDPHVWNLLVRGDQVVLLDFDVANHHWFASDIAIACQGVLFEASGGLHEPLRDRTKLIGFLDAFMAGYRQENQLADEWLERLDLFIAYRRVLLYLAMSGWLEANPEVRRRWKAMILAQPEIVGAW